MERKKEALKLNKMYFIAKEFGLTDELNLGGKTPWQSFMLVYLLILKNNPNFIFEVVSTKPMFIKLKNQYINLKSQHLVDQICKELFKI